MSFRSKNLNDVIKPYAACGEHQHAPISSNSNHIATMTSQPLSYTRIAKLMHWLLALAIVLTFSFGLYMVELPFSPQRLKQYNWHKWAGMTILILSALRLLWRLTHPAPALPAHTPAWQRLASHGTHALMYALFFAIPLAGWTYSSALGFPIVLYGVIEMPDLVSRDKELAEVLKLVHKYLAYSLAALVSLHVLAALKHHFIDKDGLLARMGLGQASR
jgi:cytochrome b561